jgi:hypothetical protein
VFIRGNLIAHINRRSASIAPGVLLLWVGFVGTVDTGPMTAGAFAGIVNGYPGKRCGQMSGFSYE